MNRQARLRRHASEAPADDLAAPLLGERAWSPTAAPARAPDVVWPLGYEQTPAAAPAAGHEAPASPDLAAQVEQAEQAGRYGHRLDRIAIWPGMAPPSAPPPGSRGAPGTPPLGHAPALGGPTGYTFVQRLPGAAAPVVDVDDELGERIRAAGGGSPLAPVAQRRLEDGLGADLSDVPVHADAEADRLARAVDATAFTAGADVFFRAGAYNPGSSSGLRLLAHEATHALQQAAGPVAGVPDPGGVALSDPGDAFEHAAEAQAAQIAGDAARGDTWQPGAMATVQDGTAVAAGTIPPPGAAPPGAGLTHGARGVDGAHGQLTVQRRLDVSGVWSTDEFLLPLGAHVHAGTLESLEPSDEDQAEAHATIVAALGEMNAAEQKVIRLDAIEQALPTAGLSDRVRMLKEVTLDGGDRAPLPRLVAAAQGVESAARGFLKETGGRLSKLGTKLFGRKGASREREIRLDMAKQLAQQGGRAAARYQQTHDNYLQDYDHYASLLVKMPQEAEQQRAQAEAQARAGAYGEHQGQVVNPTFGAGAVGKVIEMAYPTGADGTERRIAKQDPAENEEDKALASGIPGVNPNFSLRSVAASRLDRLFGTNAIVATDLAYNDQVSPEEGGGFGLVMAKVHGFTPQNDVRIKASEARADVVQALSRAEGASADLRAALEQQGWRQVERKDETGQEVPYYETQYGIAVDYRNPVVRHGLANLQLIDAICAQVDRHAGNYMIETNEVREVTGVVGIDNDFSFGQRWGEAAKAGSDAFAGVPPAVGREPAERICAVTDAQVKQEVRGVLTEAEIFMLLERLHQVQTALRRRDANGQYLVKRIDSPVLHPEAAEAWQAVQAELDYNMEGLTRQEAARKEGLLRTNYYKRDEAWQQANVGPKGRLTPVSRKDELKRHLVDQIKGTGRGQLEAMEARMEMESMEQGAEAREARGHARAGGRLEAMEWRMRGH